jgi:hypothetical protein
VRPGRSWSWRGRARRRGYGRALARGGERRGLARQGDSGVDCERVFDAGEVAAGITALNTGSNRNKAVLGFERPELLGALAVEVVPAIAALFNACRRVPRWGRPGR